MPGATESRRAMMVTAHHRKPLEDDFIVKALLGLRSPRWTPEFCREEIQRSRTLNNLRGGLSFVYPHPSPMFEGHEAGVSVVLRQSRGFQASNARTIMIPRLEQEADNWLYVRSNYKRLDHTRQMDADWFIEKMQNFLPAFEPDFACGDTDVLLANRFGDNPSEAIWPLAYYGPALVQQLGRERLLKAPAWEVKEDARGGVWLQAVQNPFTAAPAELNLLASHLGLPRRI